MGTARKEKTQIRRVASCLYVRDGLRGPTWLARVGAGSLRRYRSLGSAMILPQDEAVRRAQVLHARSSGARGSQMHTVGDLVRDYLTARAASKQPLSATEQAAYERDILRPLGRTRMDALTVPLIRSTVLMRGTTRPAAARKQLARLQRVLDHGLRIGAVDRNIARDIPPTLLPRLRSRDRVLSLPEIERIFRNLIGNPAWAPLSLLLQVMCRKGELLGMAWSEIDWTHQTWTIPSDRSKSRRALVVPLSRGAADHLAALYQSHPVAPPWSMDRRGAWLRTISRAADGIDCTVHDLRRSAATHCAEMGWPMEVIEAALNHAPPGVAGIYNRALHLDRRRDMAEAWRAQLQTMAPSAVTPTGRMDGTG